jgi:lambda family phage portal protein
MTWLDRTIGWFSPEMALKREVARLRMKAVTRARAEYDAASQSRRANNWRRSSRDANAETRGKITLIRDLSRDLVRNNPHAARAVGSIVSNVVGAGIIPQANGRNAQRANDLVKSFLDTTAIDADGKHNLYGLQGLAMRACVESGEVLIRRRRRFMSDGLPLPMQMQVLEADYLDSTKDGVNIEGNTVIQGVAYSKIGKIVGYWLFEQHPGNAIAASGVSKFIPASEIIHLYRMDRPGQARGVPWGAPIFVRLKDFGEYEDAQLVRQKIAACFAVFIHDSESPALVSGDADSTNEDLLEALEPGIVEHLPPGKDVKFAAPPGVEGYRDYTLGQLRAIASGFGVPYSVMTGDMSDVNFSSGRMGWIEFQRSIEEWRWLMFIPTVCRKMEQWIADSAFIANVDLADVTWQWTPPRREMIDPTKEVPADRDEVRAGLVSWSEKVRQRGFDPDTLLDELKSDAKKFKDAGLTLEVDAAVPVRSGVQADTGDDDAKPAVKPK